MKIVHINHTDTYGGAARAAYRLHRALIKAGTDSGMLVQKKNSSDPTVDGPSTYREKFLILAYTVWWEWICSLQKSVTPGHHTVSWSPFIPCKKFLKKFSIADVVNLHWLGNFPTVECVGRIDKPVVWTLHDMWAFCGAEHYAPGDHQTRWRTGYSRGNRSENDTGLDLDKWQWKRKQRNWLRPIHIVTPSRWLGSCVHDSFLMKGWPVHVIPNAIDTNVFKPLDRSFSRATLNLPLDATIVLFGAIGGSKDPRKGFDLLATALPLLGKHKPWMGVFFGQDTPMFQPNLDMPLRWMGKINDDWTLALLYSAADVTVVPSRQENLPQTGTEAQACGCPVVAFDTTGLPDVLEHKQTGYLARPFDTADLARGISWVVAERKRHDNLRIAARKRATRQWSHEVVATQYLELYKQVAEEHNAFTKNCP